MITDRFTYQLSSINYHLSATIMLPSISINVNNGGLGLVPALSDGQSAMLIVTAGTGLAASVFTGVKTYTRDNFNADFNDAYDGANNEQVYFHLNQFFAQAASDAVLFVGFAALTATNPQLVAKAKEIIDFAQGEIRLLGIALNKATPNAFNLTTTLGVFADEVVKPIRNYSMAGFTPLSILLEGYGIGSTDANVTGAANLKGFSYPYLSVVIGTSYVGRPWSANVGQALGWLSKMPVQRNMGRVKSSAPTTASVLIAETAISVQTAYVNSLNTKGYITYRKFAGKQGFYFVDDPTATAATDDLSSIARNRIIDKVIRLAYAIYVEEIQDEIEVNPQTGRLQAVKARYYERIIENAINATMTANGEINSVETEIDVTQNVISTNKISVKLRVVPDAYAKNILIDLGLKNPFL